ncbi:phosphoribosyltransferase [Tepidicaulis marinus]|uniref:Phosphoribosyltransferase n=1 Tax=Tepidicaulis marinus TaxID=1333998 RepID=A0A081BBI0_9HYPH|nr:ComF family protein [Tepidicaulis marinus]GAK45398.1 phosphoribosyltransferase [Tepidicaulis marinus]
MQAEAGEAGKSDGAALRALMRRAGDFLLPPRCLSCGAGLDRHYAFCAPCWSAFDFIGEPFCRITGAPFAYDPGEGAVSAAALARPPAFTRARAALLYNDAAARLISRLKYGDRLELAPTFARLMAQAGAGLLAEADLICPVPLHARRLLWRRFNQAAELSRALARLSGKPADPEILLRHRPTKAQVGLSAGARRRNVAGAFSLKAGKGAKIAGKHVLLVDDVLTTGATVEACTRVLLKEGAAMVSVLTIARVAGEEAPPI